MSWEQSNWFRWLIMYFLIFILFCYFFLFRKYLDLISKNGIITNGIATWGHGGTCPPNPNPARPWDSPRSEEKIFRGGGGWGGCCQTVLSLQSHSVEPQPWHRRNNHGDRGCVPPTFWLLQQWRQWECEMRRFGRQCSCRPSACSCYLTHTP